jgi:hypothetical protein
MIKKEIGFLSYLSINEKMGQILENRGIMENKEIK